MAKTTTERGGTRTAVPPGRPAWRKAPTRLWHRPVLFVALATGALLVVVTVATFPLFISTAQSELLTATLEDPAFTRFGAGITYRAGDVSYGADNPDGTSLLYERRDAFDEQVAKSPVLDPALESLAGPAVFVTDTDGKDPATGPVDGRLFYGDAALEHVRVIAGQEGDGVWLPDFIADPLHVGPGDRVQLHDGASVATVPIDGIYAAIYAAPRDGFWQPWDGDIFRTCPDCKLPAQFILADRAQLLDLQGRLDRLQVDQALQAPVRADPPLSIDEVHALGRFSDDLEDRMRAGPSRLGSLFSCCGRYPGFGLYDISYHSAIGSVVTIADQRAEVTRGPALVLLIAGLVIAFAAMAAAGVFAFSSRPDEAGLLRARGWGPARVGARTALESLLPIAVGGAAGLILAFVLVKAFGPDGAIGPDARRDAVVGAVVAAAAAVTVVGLVAGLMFISSHEHKARFTRFLMWVPWEIFAFSGALVLSHTLRTVGGASQVGAIKAPRPAVFLYPLTLALAVGILGARVMAVLCTRRARSPGGRRVSARWLATRRFASSARLGVVFMVAATLAVAIFVSAGGLVGSLRTTVEAKATIFVGSDVQVQIVPGGAIPADFPFPMTQVQRALGAGTFDGDDTRGFDLLVVDPATFASAAYWNDGLSGDRLDDMMGRLGTERNGAVPIVLANEDATPATITLGVIDAPVEVVGRATSFPGAASRAPLVVMSREALETTFEVAPYLVHSSNSTTELWFRGPTDEVLDAIDAAPDIQVFLLLTAVEVEDIPLIQAAVNTFLVLDVLGLVALLLIVVLAVVYLQARQRSRVLASALSTRMGIASRTLRAALVLELGGLLLVAVGLGGTVGIVATPVVVASLDPIPSIPPPPIVLLPWSAVAVAGLFLVAASFVGGWLADRATRRASLGEVMRVAGW